MAEPRRSEANVLLQVRGLNVYYGHSHALQGVDLTLDHGVLSVVGRNGMGKTTLCKAIMGLVRASSGTIRMRGQELLGLAPAGSRPPWRWLRAAGTAAVALVDGRRAPANDAVARARRLDRRARLRHLPAPGRAPQQRRRAALRRRAADAGDFARAGDQSAAPDHGRADRGSCAGDRGAGRGDVAASRRGNRHGDPRHRAEYRGGDDDLRKRRHHGQRADQPHHRVAQACGGPRTPAAPFGRWPPFRRRRTGPPRRGVAGRVRASAGKRGEAVRRADPDLCLEPGAPHALVATRPQRAHRVGRSHRFGWPRKDRSRA